MMVSLGAWTAIIAAASKFYLVTNDLINSKKGLADAEMREMINLTQLTAKFTETARAAGLHSKEIHALTEKYNGNIAALIMAIFKGKEGKELQEALAVVSREHAAAIDEQKNKLGELAKGFGEIIIPAKAWNEELNITTRLDLEKKIALMESALLKYRDAMPIFEQARLKDEIQKAKDELSGFNITAQVSLGLLPNLRAQTAAVAVSFDQWLSVLPNLRKETGNLVTEWGEGASKMEYITAESTKDIGNYFDGLMNDIATAFGNTIQKWMEGASTFKDFMKSIWQDIKTSFFRVIGQMVAEWAVGLVKNLIKGATDAATGVASSFASLGTTIGSIAASIGTIITTLATAVATAIATIATGIATALVTVATGIATAATALAAAAGAIITVGALAVALYAAFKIVGGIIDKLFGGGGKSGDVTFWLKLMTDNLQNIWNTMTWFAPNTLLVLNSIVPSIQYFGQWICNKLDVIYGAVHKFRIDGTSNLIKIAKNTADTVKAIGLLPHAQGGGYFTKPALVHVAEHGPEAILNRQQLSNLVGGGAGRNLNLTFNINAIDNEGMKTVVHKIVIPMIIDAINNNTGHLGTRLKTAQGIA